MRGEEGGKAFADRDFIEYDKPITTEDIDMLRSIGRRSINDFSSENIEKAQKWAHKFYKELGTKSPFFRAWFGDWRAYSNVPVNIIKIDINKEIKAGKIKNNDTNKILSWNPEVVKESILNASKNAKEDIRAIAVNLPNIVENAILLDTTVSLKTSKRKLEGTAFMHSFYAVTNVNGNIIIVKMYAEEALSSKSGEIFSRAYSLKYIEKVAEFDSGVHLENESLTESPSATTYSISQLFDFVKTYDKEFKPKPVNPILLNEDGTPKVFYQFKSKREQVAWLKDRGYDGWYADMDSGCWGELSVFSPNQIKSATDNIGTFDSEKSDIRFSDRRYREQTEREILRKVIASSNLRGNYAEKA